jgi:hypothetical protein
MNSGKLMQLAKTAYTAGARRAGGMLTRAGLVGSQPPPREARLKHWAYSLPRVRDALAMAELGVPWWTYRAIDVVDAWLSARPHPIRVFEYGAGASTLWLAQRADEVHSAEHDRRFGEYFAPALAGHANVELHIVEAIRSDNPIVPSAKEGQAGLDFADYVATIDKVGGTFALIVIDGRAREACITAALPRLEPGGIIVFDNSRRRRYRRAIAAAGVSERRLRGLTPALPYPDQTSVLSVPPPSKPAE